MRLFVYYLGLIFLIIGLAHPLGIVQAEIVKYMLYIGIITFGIGVILLPNRLK